MAISRLNILGLKDTSEKISELRETYILFGYFFFLKTVPFMR